MRPSLSLLLTCAFAGIACQASAADPADAARPVKEKKVCRADVSTGSIMPKRTCHTASEWAAIDKANNATAKDTLDRRFDGSVQLGSNGVTSTQLQQ